MGVKEVVEAEVMRSMGAAFGMMIGMLFFYMTVIPLIDHLLKRAAEKARKNVTPDLVIPFNRDRKPQTGKTSEKVEKMKNAKNAMIVAIIATILCGNIVNAEGYLAGSGTFLETEEVFRPDGVACTWNAKTLDSAGYFIEWRQGACARDSKGKTAPGRVDRKYAITPDGDFALEVVLNGSSGTRTVWLVRDGGLAKSGPAEIPVELTESVASAESSAKQSAETSAETHKYVVGVLAPKVDDAVGSIANADVNAKKRAEEEARRDAVYACKDRVYSANASFRDAALAAQIQGAHEASDCGDMIGSIRDRQVNGSEGNLEAAGWYLLGSILDKKVCDPKAKPVKVSQIDPAICEKNPDFNPFASR